MGFFSGVWPYVKLGMMLACCLVMLSLVDTYVLVLFVVAFSIDMQSAAPLIHRSSHRFAMLPVWRMLSSSSTCCQLLAPTRSSSQP